MTDRVRSWRDYPVWILLVVAGAIIAWARVWTLWLDPPGSDEFDWIMVSVHAVEFQVGLAILLIAGIAVWRRQWRALAAAGLLVALTVALPLAHGLVRQAPEGTADIRVLTINVFLDNDDLPDTAREIRDADPDVIVMQEFVPRHATDLVPLLDDWTLVASEARGDSFGSAALVRSTLADDVDAEVWQAELTPQVRIELRRPGADVVVYGVHLYPPIDGAYVRHAQAGARELRSRLRDEDGPVIVAGDFNATADSSIDRYLRREDLRDAWNERGSGLGWTWPEVPGQVYKPGVRIDHAYVSDDIEVIDVERLDAGASDHRPLLVDLDVR